MDGIPVSIRTEAAAVNFEDFYRMEFPRVYRAAWVSARDEHDALDATQEAFGRAFARWSRLRRRDWAAGWVITTALNLVKRRAPRQSPVVDRRSHEPPSASDAVDLRRALAKLPARQREALVLYYIGDLPVAAVAELMGVSDGTVKAHLAQGREALRGLLEVGDER
jgi:RNA polymerase sigma-70 factor, ECF subfamily